MDRYKTMENGGSCQSREWEKYPFSKSSEVQSSGRHIRLNTNTSQQSLLAVSFFILKLTVTLPNYRTIIGNLRKETSPTFLIFYHLVCLSSSSYLTLYLFLGCLLYSNLFPLQQRDTLIKGDFPYKL